MPFVSLAPLYNTLDLLTQLLTNYECYDGSKILEFADGLNLVICNTLFTKQEAKLVTYVAGPVKRTVDYIMVRQEDKGKVHNVKVISSEECVPKHKLLVMDMWFKATKTWRRNFEPRACMEAEGGKDM